MGGAYLFQRISVLREYKYKNIGSLLGRTQCRRVTLIKYHLEDYYHRCVTELANFITLTNLGPSLKEQ